MSLEHPLENRLVIALSSRALFDFEEENQHYLSQGAEAYEALQLERLEQAAKPGVAFELVKKLLAFNQGDASPLTEVVILSRNDPISGLRVFRSSRELGLVDIKRGVFTRGAAPYGYLAPLRANLFLSADAEDVRQALANQIPAARVYARHLLPSDPHPDEIRIAFDGDAVLFSDEAERVFRQHNLAAFEQHEQDRANVPLPPGPFKPFLAALHQLQKKHHAQQKIRTALVTARGAPTHERALKTLKAWGIGVDEALFLGGLPKQEFLSVFAPDFYFDDQTHHCDAASAYLPTGHVIHGIANEKR